jgi:Fur family peroxide stress response transcriptional regulator
MTTKPIDQEHRYETIVARLREEGCRLTPQRLALVEILTHTTRHLSAHQLYEELTKQFPTTSLATVYKTLNTLKDLGEVLEMGFSDDDNRYDARDPRPHPHLICVRCRRIVDADAQPADALAEKLASTSGYQIFSHRIDFYGICPDCQNEADSKVLS